MSKNEYTPAPQIHCIAAYLGQNMRFTRTGGTDDSGIAIVLTKVSVTCFNGLFLILS